MNDARYMNQAFYLCPERCENANKADLMASEFWELGLEPIPVSAISGTGTGEMLDALVKTLPPPRSVEEVESTEEPLTIAIVGRPNVGETLGNLYTFHPMNLTRPSYFSQPIIESLNTLLPSLPREEQPVERHVRRGTFDRLRHERHYEGRGGHGADAAQRTEADAD